MVRLASPNGAIIEARDEAVKSLLAMGFARLAEGEPKAAPKDDSSGRQKAVRKRAAKKKEK